MIQPCLYNRKEYKVVCFGGEPKFIASIAGNNLKCKDGINKAFSNKSELFTFCRTALMEFKSKCPYSITEGLFRVDILQMRSGKFVVNELESFEATFYSTGNNEDNIRGKIELYWEAQFRSLMQTSFEKLSKSLSFGNSTSIPILAINCYSPQIQTPPYISDDDDSNDS